MNVFKPNWGLTIEVMAGILFFMAMILGMLLVSDPAYVGITITELEGKEIRLH